MSLTKEQSHRILENIERISLEIRGLELLKQTFENRYKTIAEGFSALLNDVRGMINGNSRNKIHNEVVQDKR